MQILTAQKLSNFLGTGSNPKLILELSANGPNWNSYQIDYGATGNIPYSSNSSKTWSSWNVFDEKRNYYGTITLKSDGVTAEWDNYVGGDGYYLDGVHFVYDSPSGDFQLTVDKICQPGNNPNNHPGNDGPFPDAPVATPAKFNGTDTVIQFSTVGDKIINNNGEEIIFKGVCRPSLEWNEQGQYLSVEDIENMASWGSNVIRLDLNQLYWFASDDASVKGSYKQIIDAIIYYATENNMAVILDLHWTEGHYQSAMANKDSLIFWQEVAEKYKNFGTVIFELFNEPYGISTEQWLNGDGNNQVGYQELYDTVRATGANNLIIVGGLDYAYDLSFVNRNFKVNGKNIIYCSHPYNKKGSENYGAQGGSFDNCYQGIIGNFPLIFTEFGVNQKSYFPNGYQEVYQRVLDYAGEHGIHYTGFAWWPDKNKPEFPTLIADWNGTPINGGVLVKQDIQNKPCTPLFETKQLKNKKVKADTKLSELSQFFGNKQSLHLVLRLKGPQANHGSQKEEKTINHKKLVP